MNNKKRACRKVQENPRICFSFIKDLRKTSIFYNNSQGSKKWVCVAVDLQTAYFYAWNVVPTLCFHEKKKGILKVFLPQENSRHTIHIERNIK